MPPFDQLPLGPKEIELIVKAAKRMGVTPALFIRLAALEKANRVAEAPVALEALRRDPWDVRQMKQRAKRGATGLKVIKGGKT
jgi:hypothetical protein